MKVNFETFYETIQEFWENTNAKMSWSFCKRGASAEFASGCDFDDDIQITIDFIKLLNQKLNMEILPPENIEIKLKQLLLDSNETSRRN